MSDGNLLEKLSDKVSESAANVAEKLGDGVTCSVGSAVREDEQFLLPPNLQNGLVDPMRDLGFPIESNKIPDLSPKWYKFYQARAKEVYLAFLYIGNKVWESSLLGNNYDRIGLMWSRNGTRQ